MKKDGIAYVTGFAFVACAVFVFLLSLANAATASVVEDNRRSEARRAVLGAFGVPWSTREEVDAKYARIRELQNGAWALEVDGRTLYAVEQTGAGLWGSIVVILAADPANGRIAGLRVLSQNETPGLGGRIEEGAFLARFEGERYGPEGIRIAASGEATAARDDRDDATIDGVTGATRTSAALQAIVNAALARIAALAGGAE